MSDNCLPAGLWKTEIMKYDGNNPGAQQVIEQSAGLRVGERFIDSKIRSIEDIKTLRWESLPFLFGQVDMFKERKDESLILSSNIMKL